MNSTLRTLVWTGALLCGAASTLGQSLRPPPPLPAPDGDGPRTIHVSEDSGNDAWDGLAPSYRQVRGRYPWEPVRFSGPKKTVQAGIGAAQDRDTVLVQPGMYHEAIDFSGKAIMVRADGEPLDTILAGWWLGSPVVTFDSGEGSRSVLEGFAIAFGDGRESYTWNGKTYREAGGLLVENASATIRGCTFVWNLGASGSTGMDALVSSGSARFENCWFPETRTLSGRSVEGQDARIEFDGCIFDDTSPADDPSTIKRVYARNSEVVMSDCLFKNNAGATSE